MMTRESASVLIMPLIISVRQMLGQTEEDAEAARDHHRGGQRRRLDCLLPVDESESGERLGNHVHQASECPATHTVTSTHTVT